MKYLCVKLLLFYNLLSFSQLKVCDTVFLKKTLLYEYSLNTVSLDDMIFREKAFVEMKNNKPIYKKGIFYIDIESKKNRLNVFCIKSQPSIKFNSDSVYKILNSLNPEEINYRDCKYKKYNVEIKAIYLGKEDLYYVERNILKTVGTSMYKIIDIKISNP